MNVPSVLRHSPSLVSLFVLTFSTHAIEPWADAKLPSRIGLACWFDASAQKAARSALKLPPAQPAQLDWWLDGSGNGRHASQPVADFRPVLKTSPGGTAVRFDGTNDFLREHAAGTAIRPRRRSSLSQPPTSTQASSALFSRCILHGQNDYVAGLNVDLGGAGSGTIDRINVEAAGAGGERNLFPRASNFGTFHVYGVVGGSGANGCAFFVDGKLEGQRDRTPSGSVSTELLLGARCYGNDGKPPAAASFLRGDIAEVLVFNHALSDAERRAVEAGCSKA
jgi:hypothetical protein